MLGLLFTRKLVQSVYCSTILADTYSRLIVKITAQSVRIIMFRKFTITDNTMILKLSQQELDAAIGDDDIFFIL